MANGGTISRGLADLKVYVLGPTGTPGTAVDVAGARVFEFNTESDSEEIEGDDQIMAIARNAKRGSGSIEVGRVSLAAYAAMLGGTVDTEGTTPDVIDTYEEPADNTVIYFQVKAQSKGYDKAGSAYRVTVPNALVTSGPSESMGVSAWNTPTIDIQFLPRAADQVMVIREQYETLEALT